jgi:hypothetical protein
VLPLLLALALATPASAQFKIATDSASVAADAVVDRLDAGAGPGTLVIFGSACPDDADDADSGTTLAVLTFGDPAFGSAVDGVATANAITQDSSANATGTATCFRAKDSNSNVVFQGAITTSGGGGQIVLSSTSITAGQSVAITSLTYTQPTQTADIFAPSCSASDVQTALNAAGAGDVIAIPAGTCTWTTAVSWTAPANVTLRGAGIGATVIIDGLNRSGYDGAVFEVVTNASGSFRLHDMTFQGNGVEATRTYAGSIRFSGATEALRIDHVHFDSLMGTNLSTWSQLYGVVDSNTFTLISGGTGLRLNAANWGGGSHGDGSWADASTFGSGRFIFIEDNVFDGPGIFGGVEDSYHGSRYVVRNNDMIDVNLQTHPTGGSGRARGTRAWEIYRNTSNTPNAAAQFNWYFLSSGTGMVWDNEADTGYKNFITLHAMRVTNATYPQTATPNGWGYCGTSFNGTGSAWDGNTNASTGYPCLDQPGRGAGDLLSGDFSSVINTTTGTIAWPNQVLEPIYIWNNSWTAVPSEAGSFIANYEPSQLVENRDYYLTASSFTGATGVGRGTRASRPGTCTTGVAYWATDAGGNWDTDNGTSDDGTLDICTSTNTWTNASYTPYTYPHPLR